MTETEKLGQEIIGAVKRSLGDSENVAILFSGGIDSALLAHVSRQFCEPRLYVTGLQDSPDILWAREAAALLNMPVDEIVIGPEDIEKAIQAIVQDVGMQMAEWLTPFIPLYLAMSGTEEELVVCGQGADELFGGYRKYREIPPREAEMLMARDLEELIAMEIPYYHKMAEIMGKKVAFPFLDEQLLAYALCLPVEELMNENEGKLALREAAREIGLPEAIAGRPKKAVQYGTWVSREVKKMVKARGQTLNEYVEDLTSQ